MTASPAPVEYPDGLRGDIARLFSPGGTWEGRPSMWTALEKVATRPGPAAIALYRAGHRLWVNGHRTPAEVLWRLNLFLTGADIHPGAEIGGGLRITHTSGIVIGMGAKIGRNVSILHGVTIGGSGRRFFDEGYEDAFPVIGDDTEIWAGAAVLGPIRVGRGCHIGANAVVVRDLADGEAYTPGRVVKELRQRLDRLEAELAELRRQSRPSA